MTINKKTVNWNESHYHLHWFGSNGSELVNWQSIGIGCLTDFISRLGPRSFPSIEGNDRGPGLEMNLYTWLHWIGSNWSGLVNWQSIGIGCLTDFISRPGPRSFPSIEGNDRGLGIEMKLYTWLPVNWRIDVGLVDSRHGQYWWFAPKSRLLIGRELRMLASHWSRGPP